MKKILTFALLGLIGCGVEVDAPKIDDCKIDINVTDLQFCLNLFGVPEPVENLSAQERCFALQALSSAFVGDYVDKVECIYQDDTGWCGCFARFGDGDIEADASAE